MSKMNLYVIDNKINDILRSVKAEGIIDRMRSFNPIDYRHYIKQDMTEMIPVWKHNGTYYNSLSSLYDVAVLEGYNKEKRTFKKLLDSYDRQSELWIYKIQLVFMVYVEKLNYYYTCDGVFLTKNLLSPITGNPYNSRVILKINGENIMFNRGLITYSKFIGEIEWDEELIMFIDGFYGNCSVDNLVLKNIKDGKEVVSG